MNLGFIDLTRLAGNMSYLDWLIMIVAVVGLRLFSLSTRKYMQGVADFLSAGRVAGRYLLTVSSYMSSFGAVTFVAVYEMYSVAGFTVNWWGALSWLATLFMLGSGWMFYRYRETRAMTLAQFFEMRYSRKFRIYAAILCWVSGMIGFGIVPAVTARFFIYFCGLPESFLIPFTTMHVQTFPVVMLIDLGLAMTFVTLGGQISVMVTDCLQGIFTSVVAFVVTGAIFIMFGWGKISEGLLMSQPNKSMLNPFDASQNPDFNIWFVLIGIFATFYGYLSAQGSQGFYSAAKSPHEQKMGTILGVLRGMPLALLQVIPPIAMVALMRLPEFSGQAQAVETTLKTIPSAEVANQMRIPLALTHFLPIGIKGLLATAMLFFSFTSLDAMLHSWGSIFVQDIYLPITKKTLSPEQHVKVLRYAVLAVAVFGFLFSMIYPQTQKIMLFGATVGAIWLGGSGAVIGGGLYWKKGTTAGAYAALTVGAVLGFFGLGMSNYYPVFNDGKEFFINGQWILLITICAAGATYFVVSLFTCKKGQEFNITKLLHRGQYALFADKVERPKKESKVTLLTGITGEFTLGDKLLAGFVTFWNLSFVATFIVITTMHFTVGEPSWWWKEYWYVFFMLHFVIGIPVTIWVSVGGIIDIRSLYKALTSATRDATDDGRVVKTPDETPEAACETAREEEACVSCAMPINPGETPVVCELCGMPHHAGCWQRNGGCASSTCSHDRHE